MKRTFEIEMLIETMPCIFGDHMLTHSAPACWSFLSVVTHDR